VALDVQIRNPAARLYSRAGVVVAGKGMDRSRRSGRVASADRAGSS
jgi:hypothetical protein